MTKSDFLEKLAMELKRKNVSDTADIIEEYEQHFTFKLADGYSEEEIAAKLGSPKDIAAQYDASQAGSSGGKKAITFVGLGIIDFFFGILYVLLFAWEIIMAVFTLGCGGVTIGLFSNIRTSVFAFIPVMPYYCAVILGIAFMALTVLSAVGAIYFFGFIRQLMRAFGRFRSNILACVSGKASLPSVTVYPKFSAKGKRTLRKLFLFAVAVFAVCFIISFIICVFSSGSIEFWHTWGWFGNV